MEISMTNENSRVAIYARVSTDEQTTENQLPVLQDMAIRRGWPVIKIYSEEVSAWRAGRQKELKQLLIDASYHKYDYLFIWSLDRLSREGVGTLFHLVDTFKSYGVQVISCQEPWLEQSGPVADLLTAVTGWVAQFESKRRSERIKAAMARKKARGEAVGRKPGAKDIKPRKTMGYHARFNDRRKKDPKKPTPKNIPS
jgi:putative DNA-invertase from lambdoid prophage Rac